MPETNLALLLSVNWEEETSSYWPYQEERKGLPLPAAYSRSWGRDMGLVKKGMLVAEEAWSGWMLTLQLGGFVLSLFFLNKQTNKLHFHLQIKSILEKRKKKKKNHLH